MSDTVLARIAQTLEARRDADPKTSYVASLYGKGLNKILEKVGEEATETVIAAKDHATGDGSAEDLIHEVADLWFHSMVALSHLNVDVAEVLDCLEGRFNLSGLEEKASRSNS